MAMRDGKIEYLRRVPGLERCPERELRGLAKVVDEHLVRAGDVLVREGTAGRQAWLVTEGLAEVSVGGRPVWVAEPGSLVGDLGLLGPVPAPATVVALEDMRVLSIEPRGTDAMFALPWVSRWLFQGLDRRLRASVVAVG